ncbi:hypothetical protein CONLIGDRAFT_107538 [Coniochaeta ligniaria NRRL 30616]|uniref:Uncharacterized protein n=1 Tax=Coniochaeta ligniaria NRRL 30616 TaxID=1408157 RepID=A0A1J7I9P0_9PEZI|nr:hypothetical protein CONLIGDRAFT_107538 [Coniochaeta ligniaria NRRL 30616]
MGLCQAVFMVLYCSKHTLSSIGGPAGTAGSGIGIVLCYGSAGGGVGVDVTAEHGTGVAVVAAVVPCDISSGLYRSATGRLGGVVVGNLAFTGQVDVMPKTPSEALPAQRVSRHPSAQAAPYAWALVVVAKVIDEATCWLGDTAVDSLLDQALG